MTGIIPELFTEVSTFAALEVALRGTGEKGEYDYKIKDCVVISLAYQLKPLRVSDASIRDLMMHYPRKDVTRCINLNQAYAAKRERDHSKTILKGQLS